MKRVLKFVKKHPWLLAKCLALTTFICTLFMKPLNRLLPLVIELKGLPKTLPPPPQEPLAPQLQKAFNPAPKTFHGVYNPSWIGGSFKDPTKHPVVKTRLELFAAQKEAEAEAAEAAKLVEQQALQVVAPDVNHFANMIVEIERLEAEKTVLITTLLKPDSE
jgi:hypothetical protein